MDKITISNLYDYISYKYDDNTRILYVIWDNSNKVINSFMNEEITPYNYPYYKYNCFWVDELKRCISWKMGKKIHINIKPSSNGNFHICVCDYQENRFVYEEIGKDGYLYINPHQYIFEKILEKCNCVYNDLLDNGDTLV